MKTTATKKNFNRNYKNGKGPQCSNCAKLGVRGPGRYGHYAPTCPRKIGTGSIAE